METTIVHPTLCHMWVDKERLSRALLRIIRKPHIPIIDYEGRFKVVTDDGKIALRLEPFPLFFKFNSVILIFGPPCLYIYYRVQY